MTGHLRNVSGGDLSAEAAPGSPAASGDRLAHGGGRHMKDWIAAVSSVDGTGAAVRVGLGGYCSPRHLIQRALNSRTLVSSIKWHPMTWRATSARP